jgi:hypothetical protein
MKLTAEDRLDLLQLVNLYGHVLDGFAWDLLDQIFAPDGVFDPSDVGIPAMRGLAEIREKLIPLEEGPERDHVHNHIGTNPAIISVGDDGVVKMRSKYIVSGAGSHISFGEYFDDCVRTPDGWRIKYRRTHRTSSFGPDGGAVDAPRFGDLAEQGR